MKIQKKNYGGGRGGEGLGRVWGGGGQGGCERRFEVFVKIQKKKLGWGREGLGLGGQGGCDRRIEKFFGKIQGGGGGQGLGGGQGGCE